MRLLPYPPFCARPGGRPAREQGGRAAREAQRARPGCARKGGHAAAPRGRAGHRAGSAAGVLPCQACVPARVCARPFPACNLHRQACEHRPLRFVACCHLARAPADCQGVVARRIALLLVQEQVRRLEEKLATATQQTAAGGTQQPADAGGGMAAMRPDPVTHGRGITA